ncbi:senescence-induced receptor-like serine/threonine-protein kinase isoform X2 [Nymphaea colorata]|uniref:senescence-induced receptor-like serine/threonine-protein kinase isoform X2 n=1 Tax=Nymphaea colorata TaxID=210225 RepID=UPI00129DD55A|nr:senescence-induced receptor-like serine/threonine-protein kinase isoform X2 [Nymphaea colorata]
MIMRKQSMVIMVKAAELNLLFVFLGTVVHGQEGFINIDCGLPKNSNFSNEVGLVYVPDDMYTDAGTNMQVDPDFLSNPKVYTTLRSFPDYNRNCYNLTPVVVGRTYLVRASFMYGNYDGKKVLPTFDLYLGVNFWDTIKLDNSTHILSTEITAEAITTSMDVCLVKTTDSVPFISSLELRQLDDRIFSKVSKSLSLVTLMRINTGATAEIRYPEDHYDRIWTPVSSAYGISLNTKNEVLDNTSYWIDLPSSVLQTAVTSTSDIKVEWHAEPDSTYHFFMHFVELVRLPDNQTRSMMIKKNGGYFFGPLSLKYLVTRIVYSTSITGANHYSFSISVPTSSTQGPILNGFQVYKVRHVTSSATSLRDATAMMGLKEHYGVQRNWHSDPCLPQDHPWSGVECDSYSSSPPRIVSVDLSNSELNGTISNSFAELTEIQSLNLSGNHLQGPIPLFLGELAELTSVLDNNPLLCQNASCNQVQKGNKFRTLSVVLIVLSSVAGIGIILLIILLMMRRTKSKRQKDVADKRRLPLGSVNDLVYTYIHIVGITNDFQRVIGKGGSATVYYGRLKNGAEVAVKMLNESFTRELKEFTSEVKLLMGINHKCLVSLVGFCEENPKMILMYEYMPNGNLHNLLADNSPKELPWKKRIQIALGAASGLEYLHSGCRPSIIHRDVKTSNILLNDKMEAKLSDFGLSKFSQVDDTACVLTVVAGTPGYIDPEYFRTNMLTRKSDVYSFGVVLFELITGRPAIFKTDETVHIVQWITPKLLQEDIVSVVDPRFQGQYNQSSIWIVAKTARKCTAEKAATRPTMTDILNRLKEALEIEDNVPEGGNSIVQNLPTSALWSYCNESDYGSTSFLEPR